MAEMEANRVLAQVLHHSDAADARLDHLTQMATQFATQAGQEARHLRERILKELLSDDERDALERQYLQACCRCSIAASALGLAQTLRLRASHEQPQHSQDGSRSHISA